MKLDTWLKTTGTKPATLAKACGVNMITIYKWKSGTNMPRPPQLVALAEATGGAVTANDFVPSSARVASPIRGIAETQTPFATEARALGLDPDAIAAQAIGDAIRAEKHRRWIAENQDAIAAWNGWTDANELPLEKHRMF
ncbi:MAG: type II toxin-antitoxin system CcdA family antitoxin [Roseomonas sp.]|nr:type II toxin-antitoxin system CcdA family antitoxin [Roseomonas sp.]